MLGYHIGVVKGITRLSVLYGVDCINSGVGESPENSWYPIILSQWILWMSGTCASSTIFPLQILAMIISNIFVKLSLGYGSIGITIFNLTNLESQMNRCPRLCPPCEVLKSKDRLERFSVAGMCHGCVCISFWCGVSASSLQSWHWWFLGHLWGAELGPEG